MFLKLLRKYWDIVGSMKQGKPPLLDTMRILLMWIPIS